MNIIVMIIVIAYGAEMQTQKRGGEMFTLSSCKTICKTVYVCHSYKARRMKAQLHRRRRLGGGGNHLPMCKLIVKNITTLCYSSQPENRDTSGYFVIFGIISTSLMYP